MSRIVVAALVGLVLSGCGPEPVVNVVEENLTNEISGGNDSAAVSAMSDGTRRLTLARALVDAGLPCDGVVKAEHVADDRGLPIWRATCKNGDAYAITITPDGTANILSRPKRQ